ARLNTDGSLDTTFNVGTGPDTKVRSLALQPDGKVIVDGDFYYFNGVRGNGLVRLNIDGSIDSTFTAATGGAWAIALQPDGRIVVPLKSGAARLNKDGSLDASFTLNANYDAEISAIALQQDGKILLGGYFSTVNGTLRQNIARIWGDLRLGAQKSGNNIILTWPSGNYALQSSPSSVGTFTNVPNAVSPYTNSPTTGQFYYRLTGF
ncbi:MAG: hypothetical protein ACXWKG_07000, partial [Limisphaerales bacterium]